MVHQWAQVLPSTSCLRVNMGCALDIVLQGPPTLPQRRGYLLGACFRESLVIRLHSEIGQIHLSIEAQYDRLYFLWVTTTPAKIV